MMKKQRIFILIAVGLVALLLSAGLVVAKSGKKTKKIIEAEGCRVTPALFNGVTTCPGGEPAGPFCSENARWHVRDRQILWKISGGNELVDGTAVMDLNVNCDGSPPGGPTTGDCRMWGSFALYPAAYCNEWGDQWGEPGAEADVCIDVRGSWVGSFESIYHDGVQEARTEARGTGDLKGLILERYDVIPLGPPGAACVSGGSSPYTWRVSRRRHLW